MQYPVEDKEDWRPDVVLLSELPEQQMKKIGITGTIASGKTTVCILLRRMGYSVFDSDGYSRILYQKTNPCYEKVVALLGDAILDEFGEIDRKKTAALIFHNEDLRKGLNAIVHPAVIEGMNRFFDHHQDEDLVFAEVPLLYEAHMESCFDEILILACAKETAIQRMMEDRGYTEEEALARYAAMIHHEDSEPGRVTVLYNDSTIKALYEKVLAYVEERSVTE